VVRMVRVRIAVVQQIVTRGSERIDALKRVRRDPSRRFPGADGQ